MREDYVPLHKFNLKKNCVAIFSSFCIGLFIYYMWTVVGIKLLNNPFNHIYVVCFPFFNSQDQQIQQREM